MDLNTLSKIQAPILLLGETGTGKTTLARKIHECSSRSNRRFVSVNLAGLTDELFLSELFGYKKGAFTGAIGDKLGFCEVVGSGTLFLDEIGDLSAIQQKYLLKLLDEKKFNSVGDVREKKFNGVIIMATHKNLDDMVERGLFREDLYFRIRVFTKKIESLRDQDYSLKSIINTEFKKVVEEKQKNLTMHREVLKQLIDYNWPGNYRELKNTIEYIVEVAQEVQISLDDLPEWICGQSAHKYQNYHGHLSNIERKYLIKQLIWNKGHVTETSRHIGLSKGTLISKIKKYTIDLEYIKIISQLQIDMNIAG